MAHRVAQALEHGDEWPSYVGAEWSSEVVGRVAPCLNVADWEHLLTTGVYRYTAQPTMAADHARYLGGMFRNWLHGHTPTATRTRKELRKRGLPVPGVWDDA